MARRATGQIVEHAGKDGHTYRSLRFRAYGQRQSLSLGAVSRQQAEQELRGVLADVERGTWQPAAPLPGPPPAPVDPTFHEFAEQWWVEHEREWRKNTRLDYRWRLERHLLPFFGEHRLSQITIAEVDRYKAAKLAERDGLSGASINKTLTTLSAILESAEERELVPRNPARGRRRRVRAATPRRSYLDTAEQITALLDAARELDAEAREDRRHVERRATLATLAFAGLRIGELLDLRWRDVDLANGRLRVGDAKTDAGRRDVRLRPALRDELAALKARRRHTPSTGRVFGTVAGERQSPSNVRQRVLERAVTRANELREEAGEPPLPEGLTPHSLRRTFASVLYAVGESPATVMAEMGHTDPALALRIYAQAMARADEEQGRLRALLEGVQMAPVENLDRSVSAQA